MARYRFGDFGFDAATGELRRGADRVRLRPQPGAVLSCLLERPGCLVTRQELHRRLWPSGTHVEFDPGLNSCLRQIRVALGDRRTPPQFIETLTRRGYRFAAPVVRLDEAPANGSPCRLTVGSVQVRGSGSAAVRSFAAGLEEEAVLVLAEEAAETVVIAGPLRSDARISGRDAPNTITDYLLAICVRHEARALRVTARLSAADGSVVWAGGVDGLLDGTISTQRLAARWLSAAICRTLHDGEAGSVASAARRRTSTAIESANPAGAPGRRQS
jgi:DNA-binding winged helix-turn-helix (wHTH) protein/TolB-like protein